MKKTKLSKRTLAIFSVALVLFAGGGYMGTRAALNTFSDPHLLNINTDSVGISLTGDDYNAAKLISDDNAIPGKEYAKNISVKNDTDTKQFVRVIVRKYWEKKTEDGSYEKVNEGLPDGAMDLLQFSYGTDGWKVNSNETTEEREVFYYLSAVPAKGQTTVLINFFKISPDVIKELTSSTEGNVTKYT